MSDCAEKMDLMRMIGYCGHLGRQCLDQQLRRHQYDITPVQSHALLFLVQECPLRPITQRDLEHELRLKPSTVTGIVDRLVEKGFLVRRPSETDGRCRLLSPTEEGLRLADTFRSAADEAHERSFAALSEADRSLLRSMLQQVITTLEDEVNRL